MSNVTALHLDKSGLDKNDWTTICTLGDLVENAGVSARINGHQIAIFYVPDAEPPVYALDNWCPAAEANVLARGIVGDVNGELVVASPLYKEHFSLSTGQCVEKSLQVQTWSVAINGNSVVIKA